MPRSRINIPKSIRSGLHFCPICGDAYLTEAEAVHCVKKHQSKAHWIRKAKEGFGHKYWSEGKQTWVKRIVLGIVKVFGIKEVDHGNHRP